ncbi:ABC transporter ATP-binding protein [Stieleria marina]|uniref:Lipoprotein-releasing system ATP-binding protein LolD n=1 Tax=Stieleria marina TaxID=1930275 RepID=A0A517NZ41_9BACT|nr:Lipoprotein-releasing system ATP-binding protein LolD [Planctomycetes bacterium K23_9]
MTKASEVGTQANTTMLSDSPIVSLVGVTKHYAEGNVKALDNVSLDIARGDFLSIMGPSGSGKSTMLNMIGALDRPTTGDVLFSGQRIQSNTNLDQLRSQQIGFVFQSFYLLPNLTALENVQIPMFETSRDSQQRIMHAKRLLEQVGLANRVNHLPKQLSNGQRQRVAIARALANSPAMVLADEPTGALDSQSGIDIMKVLSELNSQHGTTLIVVTHDQNIADQAKQTIYIKDGQVVAT